MLTFSLAPNLETCTVCRLLQLACGNSSLEMKYGVEYGIVSVLGFCCCVVSRLRVQSWIVSDCAVGCASNVCTGLLLHMGV